MTLENAIYKFLSEGDEGTEDPPAGLKMPLGEEEWRYLAKHLARWLRENYTVKGIRKAKL